jgi:hypothetical protein
LHADAPDSGLRERSAVAAADWRNARHAESPMGVRIRRPKNSHTPLALGGKVCSNTWAVGLTIKRRVPSKSAPPLFSPFLLGGSPPWSLSCGPESDGGPKCFL